MPRGVGDVYSKTVTFVDGTTAVAADMNGLIDDIVTDLNTARPITMGGTGATTAAGSRSNLGISSMILIALDSGLTPGTTTYVMPGGTSTAEAGVQVPITRSGTLKNLYVASALAPGAGESFTVTVRVNGSGAGGLQAIISDTNTSANDTSSEISVSAGDLVCVAITTSGGSSTTRTNIGFDLV